MSRSKSSLSQTFSAFFVKKKREGKKRQTETKEDKGAVREMKRERRKLPSHRRHSFSVRHLLFYCDLMALLSPGATMQSPLYHMAIISIALLCDSLTLGSVTCDPSLPNHPQTLGRGEGAADSWSLRWNKRQKTWAHGSHSPPPTQL